MRLLPWAVGSIFYDLLQHGREIESAIARHVYASLLPVFPGCQNVLSEQLPQGECRVDMMNISENNIIGQC